MTTIMQFGKHAGKPLTAIATTYLKWLQGNVDDVPLLREVNVELSRRGLRYVDAAAVLADLEEAIYARVSSDDEIEHDQAGLLTDCVMRALDEVRERHGIGETTLLTITPKGDYPR